MSVKATLGGVPLAAVASNFSWTFQPGVRPFRKTFETTAEGAAAIYGQQGPLTLEIHSPGYPSLVVHQLRALSTQPGSTPYTMGVRVADRRIAWTYAHMDRGYNMRRRMGDRRLIVEGNLANVKPVPDIWYWYWSLDNGQPWTPERMIRDALDHSGVSYVLPDELRRTVLVEDLELNGRMDKMIGRALAYLAGYDCWLDAEGVLRVFDVWEGLGAVAEGDERLRTVPRDEGAPAAAVTVTPWGHAVVGSGYVHRVDRRRTRPQLIRVGFIEESEIRFDYHEEDAGERLSTVTVLDGDRPRRSLENVMPSPDPLLTVESSGKSRSVGQGSWITIDEALAAWPTSSYPQPGSAPGPLSQEHIRRHWLRGFAPLKARYAVTLANTPVPVWAQRLDAIRKHWRQTFRITRPWMDRIRSVRAYRAALLDPENGIRASSLCYCDWLAKADYHVAARKRSEYHRLGWVVRGYNDDLAQAKAAPAYVSIADSEQGIVHVGFHRDPAGEAHEVAPGRLRDDQQLPTPSMASIDASSVVWSTLWLAPRWSATVVLTCTRAAPNGKERLHWQDVLPATAEQVIGRRLGPCEGPDVVEIVVTAGRLTARFAWDDAAAEEIENAYNFGTEMPRRLMTNVSEVDAVAKAEAARYYAAGIDRLEGSCAVPFNAAIPIEGSISSVTHDLGRDGVPLTWVALAPKLDPLDEMGFVPASVQRIIRRIVQP